MSWVNELVSELGIPLGAATIAGAIYTGCVAAEKAARPEALSEIRDVISNTSWTKSAKPSTLVDRIFRLTFGERHFSWKCVRRSVLSTIVVNAATGFYLYHSLGYGWFEKAGETISYISFWILICVILCGFTADYLSLAKTRLIIRRDWAPSLGAISSLSIVVVDVILCVLLSWILMGMLYTVIFFVSMGGISTEKPFVSEFTAIVNVQLVLVVSTLMTSVWTALIMVALVVLKLLSPLQRFTLWFFDVRAAPLTALGTVAAALVLLGAGVVRLLHAMI